MAVEDNNIAKRRDALNYLLSQIFGHEDFNELEQYLIQTAQSTPETFVVKPEVTEPVQVNYPGFTGKRFTALQKKIESMNKIEEDVPDANAEI